MSRRAVAELGQLAAVERQMEALELERVRLMAEAQRNGASWEAIAEVIGTSRQAAWETYRDRVRRVQEAAAEYVSTEEAELLESAAQSLAAVRARRRRG